MKKFLTVLFAISVATSLAMPVFAKKHHKKSKDTDTTLESTSGKAHKKHAKKKGATEGQKEGQEGQTTPKQ